MNRQIRGVWFLLLIVALSACAPASDSPAVTPSALATAVQPTRDSAATEPTPTRESIDLANVIQVQVRPNILYQFENPGGRWNLSGRDLTVAGYPSTFIQVDIAPRPENIPFAEALQSLTAEPFTIETANGVTYVEVTNNIGARIIYRDDGEAIISILLLDSIDDEVQEQYVADWRDIALTGELVVMR